MKKNLESRYYDIDRDSFIAENASIVGQVKIGRGSSIWYGAVIRGDFQPITIGEDTNIQDNATVHVGYREPCTIGSGVTIGHNALIHGCTIADNVLVGMGAIILNGAIIGKNSIIGAGALVTEASIIPENSMVMGMPARVRRSLRPEEILGIERNSREYVELWRRLY